MLSIQIITPERTVFTGEAKGITLPGIDGELTILPGHIPLISLLKTGEIVLRTAEGKRHMAIYGGFFEILNDKVKLLTDSAELEDEIDERRAKEALERAQLAKERAQDAIISAEAAAAIERALIRLKVAERRKGRHRA